MKTPPSSGKKKGKKASKKVLDITLPYNCI